MPRHELVRSLLRGLDVLNLIAGSEGGVRLKDVARELGLKAPTAHNLLRTLSARGFVKKADDTMAYRLGPALYELLAAHHRSALLTSAAKAVGKLHAELPDATLTLATLLGNDVFVLLRMSPDRPGLLQKPLGRLFGAYTTASGLVCQACMGQDELGRFRRHHLFGELGAHLWGTAENLDAYLDDVRRLGYALLAEADGEFFRVAAPVFGRSDELQAVLGVSSHTGADDAAKQNSIVDAILTAAQALSEHE